MPWGQIGAAAIGAAGSLIGGAFQNSAARDTAALQYQAQKEFAQNGIRWKVADAKAAGIHPLAALGAQTVSYNPVGVQVDDGGISEALGRMGQGVSRAMEAKQLAEERQEAKARQEMQDVFNSARNQKELEHLDLQNRFLETQIKGAQQQIAKTALPPPMAKANNVDYSLSEPYGKDFYSLLTLARHGDTLYELPHPDIADSITETEWKNVLSMIDAEAQAQNGTIKPPLYKLSPEERKAVKEYRYELVRIPGVGWKLDRNPSRPHRYHKLSDYEKFRRKNSQRWSNGRREVTGKIF